MILIENIGILATMTDEGMLTNDPVVMLKGESIAWVGSRAALPAFHIDERIDAQGAVVMPGLIDCHSHLIFAGIRADEFARRMAHESYQNIMAEGGGIMSTVHKTRAASDEELLAEASRRARSILAQGVTTLELKSGYGLSLDDELRILRLAKKLDAEVLLDLHPTFLGAHVVPKDYADRRDAYVSLVVDEMLPHVACEKLAIDCDIFCETGAFSVADARRILSRAHELGLGLRAHVQQLGLSGGASLVKELPIKSVSHADYLSDDDIAALLNAHCVVETLPFAALFLRSQSVTPVEKLAHAGIPLAIATDFNPGSAMCHDLILAARLGVTYLGFSIELALRAITSNAALSLGRRDIGVIAPQARADIVITNCLSIEEIFYDWTKHPVTTVFKRGERILT